MKISFIGSGNMGFALMKAASKIIKAENIFITDADIEKARNAASIIGANVLKTNTEAAENGDFIFLAVKPQVLQQVLGEISPIIKKRQNAVLVSMAAGWSISKIQSSILNTIEIKIGKNIPVVRIMPNTPALVEQGMIAMSVSKEVPEQKTEELKNILSGAGIIDIIDEHYMDSITALSGSGPAFVYLFIEALADGAVRTGLPRDKAYLYAAQTIKGASAMLQETGKHPGELKDMVTSPGGTTIAGLAALEDGAFRSTVMKAVEAAWNRAGQLS
ncbi:MAG: pyrroline-5-carboxylate reductase [Treponema sp.]|nr:pyrroline-5-carboxylate reductase [Treponema sp.]MCL2250959.1 pyrroline-5-carboxylate reductase [Treponema sp.]